MLIVLFQKDLILLHLYLFGTLILLLLPRPFCMILFMIVTFLARLCRVRRDQNRHGGGIMFLTKHSLQAVERHDLEEDCELMWV